MHYFIGFGLIVICLSVLVFATSFKIAAILFKKPKISMKALSLIVLVSITLGGFAAFMVYARTLPDIPQYPSIILQLIATVAAWVLSIIIIKKSLSISLRRSTGIFTVAMVLQISFAVCVGFTVRTFFLQAFKIPSAAMAPTILVGDHLLANKFVYRFRDPMRGEVVIFRFPLDQSKNFIKRVIGVPGDKIEIRDKVLFINGEAQEESYVQHTDEGVLPAIASPRDNLGPLVVPPDSLFVLGDNRDESYDSRFWNYVEISSLKGKALLIYWANNTTRIGMEIK